MILLKVILEGTFLIRYSNIIMNICTMRLGFRGSEKELFFLEEVKRHFSLSFSDQKVVPCSSTRGKRFATVVMATAGKKEKMEKPPEKTI